jgi:hypothetical protein
MANPIKSPGDIVTVVVTHQRPFGVFVDMDGEKNALIQAVVMHEPGFFVAHPTGEFMPPTGALLRAIVLGKSGTDQYQLSLQRAHFARFGHESDWVDWAKEYFPARNDSIKG